MVVIVSVDTELVSEITLFHTCNLKGILLSESLLWSLLCFSWLNQDFKVIVLETEVVRQQ